MTSPPPAPIDEDALIATLVARIEALVSENAALKARLAELEAKLGLPPEGPDNSSVPPSQGRKASGPSPAKPKTKPHRGSHRPLHPKPTRTEAVFAHVCDCGADLSGVAQEVREAYDHVEIPPIEPDVTRVVLHGGVCPCCARRFKATPPTGLEPGSPFGPNLRAFVFYLRSVQGIPLARLSEVLRDLLGLEISEGALVNILRAGKAAFGRQVGEIKAALFAGAAIASDETGLRVGKDNWWLWVFHHASSAVFGADRHRSRAVGGRFLGDWRPDDWISDRYAGQMDWARNGHQVCLAHFIRDAQYVVDPGDAAFAPALIALLRDACAIGARRDRLADATLKAYDVKLNARLDRLMRIQPPHPSGEKLRKVVKKIRRHLFLFVTRRDLTATNNGSERAIRPCAVYRKITNGFRAAWAAELYADTRSSSKPADDAPSTPSASP